MDIVYLIDSRRESKVLRYSLRSLRFIDHNRVFIIGKAPSYVKGIEVIEYQDKTRPRTLNLKDKYQLILNSDISEDFVLFNDDFYLTQDDGIHYYYWEELKNLVTGRKEFPSEEWTKDIKKLLKAFPEGKFYEVHAPIIFNKTKLSKIIEKLADRDYHAIRSWYCNTYKVKSTFTFDHKIYSKDHQLLTNPKAPIPPFISSADNIEDDSRFLRLMRRLYPDPSPYENAQQINQAPKTLPIIRKQLPITNGYRPPITSNPIRSLNGFQKKSHIVLTRLHYRENDPLFDIRLATYRVLTLPRLLDQEDKDFDIGVICNPAHAKIVESIHSRVHAITTTKFGNKDKKGFYRHSLTIKDLKGLKKYDIQTSIDSDDLVAPQFTRIIQEEIFHATRGKDISTHIHFNFDIFNLKTLETKPIKVRYNDKWGSAFYSLYQPTTQVFINQKEHTYMPLLAQQSIFISDIYCHATVHDWNDSTSLNK